VLPVRRRGSVKSKFHEVLVADEIRLMLTCAKYDVGRSLTRPRISISGWLQRLLGVTQGQRRRRIRMDWVQLGFVVDVARAMRWQRMWIRRWNCGSLRRRQRSSLRGRTINIDHLLANTHTLSVKLHLTHKRTDGRRDASLRPSVRSFVRLFVCCVCQERPCFGWARTAMLHRNLRGIKGINQ